MAVTRILCFLFGLAFIGAGVAGNMPQFTTDGLLLGLFEVDHMHNMVHIVSGVIAILASVKFSLAKLYFKLFGLVYGAVAVLGVLQHGVVFGMPVNPADNYLHAGIAVVALYIGFLFKPSRG